MVEASGWEQIQRTSEPACGGGGKRQVELAFLASFESEHRDTPSRPACSLCQDWGEWGELGHCWFWGRETVEGHCCTDVLVCGPASSPEKASGEDVLVLHVQAPYHVCQGSSSDFEIT